MAQAFYFPCWDSEKLPPVFFKLSPQPNVFDGSLWSKEACNFIELLMGLGFNSPDLCKENATQVGVTQSLVWDLHQPDDLCVDKDDPVPKLCLRIGRQRL